MAKSDVYTLEAFEGDEAQDCGQMLQCHCGRYFASQRGLTQHMNKAHGRSTWSKDRVGGTICQICLDQHWTVARLRRHLDTSLKCGMIARLGGWVEETEEDKQKAADLYKEQASMMRKLGRHENDALMPVLRLKNALR